MNENDIVTILEEIEQKDDFFRARGYDRVLDRKNIHSAYMYGRVLDAGIGDCHTIRELMQIQGISIVSVDVSSDAITRGRIIMEYFRSVQTEMSMSHFEFVQADLTSLPFSDSSFDCSVAVNTLHHIPKWQVALGELLRVTNDRLVIQEFSTKGKHLIDKLMLEQSGELKHSHEFDGVSIRDILDTIVEMGEYGWSYEVQPGEMTDLLIIRK
jgi:ubiquinone/menaquinone biosynthesis C-methylase UbiE